MGLAYIGERVFYWLVWLLCVFPRLVHLTAVRWDEVPSGPLLWPNAAAIMLAMTLIIPFQNHLLVYALFLWCSRDTVFLEANECLGVKWPVLKRVQVPFLHSSCCCADDEVWKGWSWCHKAFFFLECDCATKTSLSVDSVTGTWDLNAVREVERVHWGEEGGSSNFWPRDGWLGHLQRNVNCWLGAVHCQSLVVR